MTTLEWPHINPRNQNGRAIRDLTDLDLSLAANDWGGIYLHVPIVDPGGSCLDFVRTKVSLDMVQDLFRTALADSPYEIIVWMQPCDGGSVELQLMNSDDVDLLRNVPE